MQRMMNFIIDQIKNLINNIRKKKTTNNYR
jgi:hypothetical protein